MLSCLYEDPQYLAALLRRSEPKEVDLMVDIITQRLYSNHYKARDEFLMLSLLSHVLSEDLAGTSDPTDRVPDGRVVNLLRRPVQPV